MVLSYNPMVCSVITTIFGRDDGSLDTMKEMITKKELQDVLDRVDATMASWSPEKREAMSTTGGYVPKVNKEPQWERINNQLDRIKIEGGWIYRCHSVGITFVPDPK